MTARAEGEAESQQTAEAKREAEVLVPGAVPGDVDDRRPGGELDGEEAVVALQARKYRVAVARDVPVGVVAEVKDKRCGQC